MPRRRADVPSGRARRRGRRAVRGAGDGLPESSGSASPVRPVWPSGSGRRWSLAASAVVASTPDGSGSAGTGHSKWIDDRSTQPVRVGAMTCCQSRFPRGGSHVPLMSLALTAPRPVQINQVNGCLNVRGFRRDRIGGSWPAPARHGRWLRSGAASGGTSIQQALGDLPLPSQRPARCG